MTRKIDIINARKMLEFTYIATVKRERDSQVVETREFSSRDDAIDWARANVKSSTCIEIAVREITRIAIVQVGGLR